MGRSKYKKLADLYATGKEAVFMDGTVVWMQVLNEFEKADCRRAAQAERGKLVMALRETDTPEWEQLQGYFGSQTKALTIDELCTSRLADWYVKCQEAIENDPDWRERLEILKRDDEVKALPDEDPQVKLFNKINVEYVAELTRRLDEERAFYSRELEKFSEDELLDEYKERWLTRRGTGAAMVEYALWELYQGARACEAEQPEAEGAKWDHSKCNHHEKAFDSAAEVRDLPDEIKKIMRATLDDVAMTEREAKNSDRSLSSSAPSQGPEPEGESQPSIPEEIALQPLGSSPSQ